MQQYWVISYRKICCNPFVCKINPTVNVHADDFSHLNNYSMFHYD
jgi:hypothetical protein